MIYTFRWRTGPLTDVVVGEYIAEATTLNDAVTQFKQYIRNRGKTPLIVSYFYFVQGPEKTALGEFTYRYYKKHFLEFQYV